MKKLKFLGTAVLAASLLFAGCSSPEVDDPTGGKSNPAPAPAPVDNPDYEISFTGDNSNGNTYSYADGVYTVSVANANDSEWGNQVFISNPNADVELVEGDAIHVSIKLEANKEIATMFVKDQFNAVTYSGIDTAKNLPADTATVFDIYGKVAADYDDSASIVLALRGNEADTTLKISEIKVEKIENYSVTAVKISASSVKAAFGETVTLNATDQYGIPLDGVEFEITTEGAKSTITDNKITAAKAAEEIKVIAKYNDLVSEELTITVYSLEYSDIVLFNSEKSINEMNFSAVEYWWGVWTVNAETGVIEATGDANGCFGIPFKTEQSFKEGAKLEITYTANNAFAVKPVAPDKEFMLEASATETTKTIELGGADKMSKLGIVFKSDASTASITSIKIINE